MGEENFYQKREREACEELSALLALPVPDEEIYFGCEGYFDPWSLFPCFYGSYSSAFDDMALTVLRNLDAGLFIGEGLAHEMFREVLCTKGLCDYGTSPRVCFPSGDFRQMLKPLLVKWEEYCAVRWA